MMNGSFSAIGGAQRMARIAAVAALLPGGAAALPWCQLRQPPRVVRVQAARTRDLAPGKFLVASRDLQDPNFSKTVILLVQYDEQGVVGLILNRRSTVLLADAFPALKAAKGRSDTVYLGGPVGRTGALALIRSRTKLNNSEHVLADIYLTASQAVLDKTLRSRSPSPAAHVYLGYGGWTADQLRREVELGAWFIFPADAAAVFDANPDSMWQRWILRTGGQIALGGSAPSLARDFSLPSAPAPTRHFWPICELELTSRMGARATGVALV